MKRLPIVVTALVVVALAMGSLMQGFASNYGTSVNAVSAVVGPADRGGRAGVAEAVGPRAGAVGRGRRLPQRRFHAGHIQYIIRIAVLASWAKDDAEVQKLVDQGIADRKLMIKAEAEHIEAFEELIKAIRDGDEDTIKARRDAMVQAGKKLREATREVLDDIKVLVKKLRELCPKGEEGARLRRFLAPPAPGPGAGARRQQGRGLVQPTRPGRAGGGRGPVRPEAKDKLEDDIPLDIY